MRHPLSTARRERLARMQFATAEKLRSLPHGRRARAAGLVIGRQRPGHRLLARAFVTLEDETGTVNVVVWTKSTRAREPEARAARLSPHGGLDNGVIEREGDVVHLVASRLGDQSRLLGSLPTASRDFH